jgi:hypothetical protein
VKFLRKKITDEMIPDKIVLSADKMVLSTDSMVVSADNMGFLNDNMGLLANITVFSWWY